MSQSLLIVDDDPAQRRMVAMLAVKRLGLKAAEAGGGAEALSILSQDQDGAIAAVVLDLNMPKMHGLEVLQHMTEQFPSVPVVILTASLSTEDAITAMKRGAADFLTKPFEADRFVVTLTNAMKHRTLEKEVARLKRREDGVTKFSDLIGYQGGLVPAVGMGVKAAASNIPVLITGETGTGKEIFARAIHGESARSGQAFVAINCGAIPAQLVESTLFGHEKGAFTGAVAKSAGKFREADGGTIFLDEVGELPPDAQVKLLRVLQQKEVEPVGAGLSVPVDVRVISATHRDLGADVHAGRFREDLFFRLNVLGIHLPPLRDRRGDIPALARAFAMRFSAQEKKSVRTISDQALARLSRHDWPGNVRELENTIHRAMVLSDHPALQEQDFDLSAVQKNGIVLSGGAGIGLFRDDGMPRTLEDIELEVIRRMIHYRNGNISRAAEDLGVAKSTLYRKLDIKGE
jgi:DNA-binding NtrC family response regulator